MGFDDLVPPGGSRTGASLDDLLTAVRSGALGAPIEGRRRRRAAKARLRDAGAIAAALGLEGCLAVLPGGGPDMAAPENPPGSAPPTSEPLAIHENQTVSISVAQLLASQVGAAEITGVSGAAHGTAQLSGSIVTFTPTPGYTGAAQIEFTYTDKSGVSRTASFELVVDDDKVVTEPHNHPGGGDHGDHAGSGSGGAGDGTDPNGGHDHGGAATPHADDPGKQGEHLALMALVPVAEATHVAIKDGSWFDPLTWANGAVPGDGARVLIPEGITVAYDSASNASIFTVRVDGELDFATDRNTFMEVDTFVVTPTGHLTIGTLDNPVAADVEAVISIASNGPIDVAWDPMLLSRGLISHGAIEINGAEKASFIRLAADPMAGDTSLLLDEPPEGWRVGDRLVLTGTHLANGVSADPAAKDVQTEDEELVITRIEGNRLYVDRALQYDHEGARSDLKAYVANYTRNVRIGSEDGEATPTHERGHVMFMHSDNVDVRYAEFYELGRTDKSERAFDVGDLATVEPDSNVKARYPLHIHRAGVTDLDDPVMLVGNAVWGAPGWGVVHHDSNAILSNNAAYDTYGAAFVAETGNETGRWTENIAIKSIGVDHLVKDGGDVGAFDLGRTGVGFWFQGRLVDAVGNVAAGMPSGHGYVYMHRIPAADQLFVDPDTTQQSDTLRYVDKAFIYEPNINKFYDNEAIAVAIGIEVVKPGPQQHHDVRSVLEDFTAWEVHTGVFLQYTGHYTLKNLDLVATDSDLPWRDTSIGIRYFTNVFDTVVNGADIQGFNTGVYLDHSSLFDGVTNFRYIFVDANITGAANNYIGSSAADRILSSADIVDRTLSYESAWGDGVVSGPMGPHDAPLTLNGAKTDSLGRTETSTDWDPFTLSYWNIRGAVEENGYWLTADGRRVTLVEEYVADRATGEISKFAVFVEVPTAMSFTPYAQYEAVRVAPEFHGVLDPDSRAPVGGADAYTVHAGEKAILDVLANDFDPDGDAISLDGATTPNHGHVVQNDDGTLSYFADPGFSGVDMFAYWVEDEHGNFTKTPVTVTVEI